MSEVSRFRGIVVRVFHDDHGVPHFHAEDSGRRVKIAIRNLALLRGRLHPKKFGLLMSWASEHQEELLEAWERAQRGQAPGKIEPLD